MPPPSLPLLLPETVLLLRVRVPALSIPPPLPLLLLPETVLSRRVSMPLLLIPPPLPSLLLSKTVLFISESVPTLLIPPPSPLNGYWLSLLALLMLPKTLLFWRVSVPLLTMPPPSPTLELLVMILFWSVSVPSLLMPLPSVLTGILPLVFWIVDLPSLMVKPEMVTFAATSNTAALYPPLTESIEGPGPLMTKFLSINSNPVFSLIVPVRPSANVIVLPGLALAIAWRRDPGPLSLRVVTFAGR